MRFLRLLRLRHGFAQRQTPRRLVSGAVGQTRDVLDTQSGMEPPLDGPALGLLLLTYSFLVKAAVDCPRPGGNENTVMTTETLLMNEFPNGVEVSLECANGYVRERGSDIIMCMNGKWSELELTCTSEHCPP
ncbi:hypothetical protein Q5P01_001297 [Channa striata]|uniref:Sushi domain-containing protein n=1 Tax=Channa striata TaxID=64152 RepID=A0AA88NPB3_CHASR|nr:hypothetical protein Q5P01_001297 [Channa striata]